MKTDKQLVRKRYILLLQEGAIPDVKVPKQSIEGVIEMLRETHRIYPEKSTLLVELTGNDDLWVDYHGVGLEFVFGWQ